MTLTSRQEHMYLYARKKQGVQNVLAWRIYWPHPGEKLAMPHNWYGYLTRYGAWQKQLHCLWVDIQGGGGNYELSK